MKGTPLLLALSFIVATPARGQECSAGASVQAAECGAVTFEGCCDGELLLFCEGGMLCARDCTGLPRCGWNPEAGYYDCGSAGMADPAGLHPAACPAGGGGGGGGGGDEGDVTAGIDLDGVPVPDLPNAPSSCAGIQGFWEVAASDCGIFSSRFGIKQEGCVAVLVELVGDALPAARVTQSGLSFEFLDAGLTRSCLGQLTGGDISGECLWNGGACTFTFRARVDPVPGAGDPSPGGGGCGPATPASTGLPALLLPFLSMLLRRRTSQPSRS